MRRRTVLRAAGVGILGGLAGCLGSQDDGSTPRQTRTERTRTATETESGSAPFEHAGTLDESFVVNGDYPTDDDSSDGLPPAFPDPPDPPDADPASFDTASVNGESVRLAPIDVVDAWYRRGEARMVDARGLGQYVRAHAYGAVLSTYQQGSTGGGIDGWDPEDRVVTYCTCPHHMSTVRAAGLQKAGFSNVFAIDEGFGPWYQRAYPMAGTSFAPDSRARVSEWTLSGSVPARYAGETVHASTGRQYEAGPVRADGSYELGLRFWDVSAETRVELATPAYTVTGPLGDLSAGTVTGH